MPPEDTFGPEARARDVAALKRMGWWCLGILALIGVITYAVGGFERKPTPRTTRPGQIVEPIKAPPAADCTAQAKFYRRPEQRSQHCRDASAGTAAAEAVETSIAIATNVAAGAIKWHADRGATARAEAAPFFDVQTEVAATAAAAP